MEFVRQAGSFKEYLALAAIAAPLIDMLVCIGSPWPNRSFVAFVTVVAELIVYMFCYELWHRRTISFVQMRFRVSLLISVILFAAYIVLFANVVWPAPNHRNREVVGTTVRKAILDGIEERRKLPEYANYSLQDAFRDNEYKPEKIWERQSLANMRVIVLAVWIGVFVAVTFGFTTFLILQRKRAARGS